MLRTKPAGDKEIIRRRAGTGDAGNGDVPGKPVTGTLQVRDDGSDVRFTKELGRCHLAARERVGLAPQVIITVVRVTSQDRQLVGDP